MKILVTGGAGFIGSHIVEELVNRGEDVTVIDNLCAGSLKNLETVKDKINFVKGDIRDIDLLRKEFQGMDFVSHQAALVGVPESIEAPEEFNDVNINGHLNVLKAAHECNVKRVVFASSCAVYGEQNNFPIKEDFSLNPKSPYALTKLKGERYCRDFYEKYNLETVSLRYFNVFGPRQDTNSPYAAAIPIFTKRILNAQPPIVYGDGLQSRDFIHVKNVVEANLLMFKADNAAGQLFNVCEGISITILDIIKKINNILGKNIMPKFTEKREGDIRKSLGDPSKIKSIGFKTVMKFDKALEETVEWFKQHL